jgi:hypothetical protein
MVLSRQIQPQTFKKHRISRLDNHPKICVKLISLVVSVAGVNLFKEVLVRINLFLTAIFFIFFPVFIHAQTAAELESLMNVRIVTYAEAANFVLNSAGTTVSERTPFQQAVANGWIKNPVENEHITMGELSFLIMSAFEMRGGVMYSFFPGPRYAYKSMVSNSYIQGISDPDMTVSGERFLIILGKVMNTREDE